MKVRTIRNLNVRHRQPNINAPLKGIIYKGFTIEVEGTVKGQKIGHEDTWYYDNNGDFYWAGGVKEVIPPIEAPKENVVIEDTLPVDLVLETLSLGKVDKGSKPSDITSYLKNFHEAFGLLKGVRKFKGEGLGKWSEFREVTGSRVGELQTSLKFFGFYPYGPIDGIYGYKTMSSVRLFQEYIRSEEGNPSIGVPDGIAGPNTLGHINKWLKAKKKSSWRKSRPSGTYKKWMDMLNAYKSRCVTTPTFFQSKLRRSYGRYDTMDPSEWKFTNSRIHLIGIRKNAKVSNISTDRKNDDLFVLLIEGNVYKFYGSTDPSRKMTSRSDEPYIVEGQHEYRFGWHKLSDRKVYRAFKPFKYGVAVVRDEDGDGRKTMKDKVDTEPNLSINIHWSGMGLSNWSAGCQVIAGSSYLLPDGEFSDCKRIGAWKYDQLGQQGKGRGAYSLLVDLITAFSKKYSLINGQKIYYTLVDYSYLQDHVPGMAKQVDRDLEKLRNI